MDDSEFLKVLAASGIPTGSKDWKDYEEAKKWATTVARDGTDYERLIRVAAEYVGV